MLPINTVPPYLIDQASAFSALVVDDHPMCREAARMALKAVDPDLTVNVVGSLADALSAVHQLKPRIISLDLSLPDCNGFTGLLRLQAISKNTPVVIVSGHDSPSVTVRAYRSGAAGFVSKSEPIAVLIEAFRAVLAGRQWFSDTVLQETDGGEDALNRLADLTPAQRRVLDAMGNGRLNKQLAYDLGLSEITVKAHIKEILRKLNVSNRTQAILLERATRF